MTIELETNINQSEYNNFVFNNINSTFYQSLHHIMFLERILQIKAKFIVKKKNSEILGILPFFEKKTEYGKVINSLPFFGSYGGIISTDNITKKEIIKYFNIINKYDDVISSVLIENPFYQDNCYNKYFNHNLIEERLTQCTILNGENKNSLMKKFEKRVRWSIKKCEKNFIEVNNVADDEYHVKNFYRLHKESMEIKNGQPKPSNIFSIIKETFVIGKDYDIFVALKKNIPISYILVFYFKNFTEYYMPAYEPQYIHLQGTSFLIWKSMLDCLTRGIRFYNFGGTWKNQKNLYLFKRGWAAKDFFYSYYIYCDLPKIQEIGLNKILLKYKNFYVCPYDKIFPN